MFFVIKNFFTKVAQLTSTFFIDAEIIEQKSNSDKTDFLPSEIINEEPEIKKIKRSSNDSNL